jgi:hypothetical protein
MTGTDGPSLERTIDPRPSREFAGSDRIGVSRVAGSALVDKATFEDVWTGFEASAQMDGDDGGSLDFAASGVDDSRQFAGSDLIGATADVESGRFDDSIVAFGIAAGVTTGFAVSDGGDTTGRDASLNLNTAIATLTGPFLQTDGEGRSMLWGSESHPTPSDTFSPSSILLASAKFPASSSDGEIFAVSDDFSPTRRFVSSATLVPLLSPQASPVVKGGPNIAAIVGGVIGALALLAACALLIFCLFLRKEEKSGQAFDQAVSRYEMDVRTAAPELKLTQWTTQGNPAYETDTFDAEEMFVQDEEEPNALAEGQADPVQVPAQEWEQGW